jgi:hypothetical protein
MRSSHEAPPQAVFSILLSFRPSNTPIPCCLSDSQPLLPLSDRPHVSHWGRNNSISSRLLSSQILIVECLYRDFNDASVTCFKPKKKIQQSPWLKCSSLWNLWWMKCHCYRFFSQYFGSPLSVSFHQFSKLIRDFRFSQQRGRDVTPCHWTEQFPTPPATRPRATLTHHSPNVNDKQQTWQQTTYVTKHYKTPYSYIQHCNCWYLRPVP